MPGLLELGPMTAEVVVMGHSLTLHPLSVDDVIALFSEFPQLINMLVDGKAERANAIKVVGPLAIAKVICCSTRELRKLGALDVASSLSIGATAAIIDKIMEITFEDGIGPFVAILAKRAGDINQLNSSATQSSVPLSGALVGDAPRPIAEQLRRASLASGSTASTETKQHESQASQ
jgi:hypothetical protein